MPYNSVFLDSIAIIDNGWEEFIDSEVVTLVQDIEGKIIKENSEYTPKSSYVLRFLAKPLSDIKVMSVMDSYNKSSTNAVTKDA